MFSSYVQIRESAIYQSTKLACICAVNGPYPPTELAVHLVDSRTVKLQWKEPPLHGSPIVAYSIHYHSTRSGELQKVVRNTSTVLGPLTPFTNYTFFVKAYSSRGYSDPSSSVSLFTGDDGTMTFVRFVKFSIFHVVQVYRYFTSHYAMMISGRLFFQLNVDILK